MMHISNCESAEGPNLDKFADFLGPAQVDQTVRHAIQFCWMALPKERKTVDGLEREIRRIVERALKDFREDSEAFGRTN